MPDRGLGHEPVREIVQDGVNGRLFPFFDEKALAERVRETLTDREKSAAMARRPAGSRWRNMITRPSACRNGASFLGGSS